MTRVCTKIMAALAALLVAASVILMLPRKTEALQVYYDKIHYYGIKAEVLPSGAVEFTYTFEWEVIVDVVDEPFTWVKIGIPNSSAHKFKALSDNIKSVKYMNENYGSYAKVKFRKTYHAGDIINFSFSFVQENLFEQPDSYSSGGVWSGLCIYDFTAGWFDEIPVERYEIKWNADYVVKYTNNMSLKDGYLIASGSLKPGEKANIVVGYKPETYAFKYSNIGHPFAGVGEFLAENSPILGMFALLITISIICKGDSYDSHGGHFHGGHGGGGCACACACACAGGGRAGCTKKDFYGTKVSTMRIRKVLRDGDKDA